MGASGCRDSLDFRLEVGLRLHEFAKVGSVQPHQLAIGQRRHGGLSVGLLDQRHLAEEMSGSEMARSVRLVDFDVAGNDEIDAVSGFATTNYGEPGRNGLWAQELRDLRDAGGVETGKHRYLRDELPGDDKTFLAR